MNLDKLLQMCIDVDAVMDVEMGPESMRIKITGNQDYVEQTLQYEPQGVLFVKDGIASIRAADLVQLCQRTYNFLQEQEGSTTEYTRIRGAEKLVARVLRQATIPRHLAEYYASVAELPNLETLLILPAEEQQKIKDYLTNKAKQMHPLGNRIRIRGSSLFANFCTADGKRLFPSAEPYITGCGVSEALKKSLENYWRQAENVNKGMDES